MTIKINGARKVAEQAVRKFDLNNSDKQESIDRAVALASDIQREECQLELAAPINDSPLVRIAALAIAQKRAIPIYAPSCPDYTNDGKVYVFGGMGSSISLLAQYHLRFAERLLPLFEQNGVNYDYNILSADIEGLDETLLKLNGISKDEFDQRIASTIRETGKVFYSTLKPNATSSANSSGFLDFFDDFTGMQAKVENRIRQLMQTNESFVYYLNLINSGRYDKLYSVMFGRDEDPEFYMQRTIRTMAQYAALGHFARQNEAAVITHMTLNSPAYNDHRLSLEPDAESTFKRIAVFNFARSVY